MKNLENNYLSNHKWKSLDQIELDEEILIDLSYKDGIRTIDELRAFTDQQISDLIKYWDAYESYFSEIKLNNELDKLIEEKNIWKLVNFLTDLDYEKNWSY